jgi:hypothetical protein
MMDGSCAHMDDRPAVLIQFPVLHTSHHCLEADGDANKCAACWDTILNWLTGSHCTRCIVENRDARHWGPIIAEHGLITSIFDGNDCSFQDFVFSCLKVGWYTYTSIYSRSLSRQMHPCDWMMLCLHLNSDSATHNSGSKSRCAV